MVLSVKLAILLFRVMYVSQEEKIRYLNVLMLYPYSTGSFYKTK